jgi:hypothetical protein
MSGEEVRVSHRNKDLKWHQRKLSDFLVKKKKNEPELMNRPRWSTGNYVLIPHNYLCWFNVTVNQRQKFCPVQLTLLRDT